MYVQRIHTADQLAELRGSWNCLTHGVPFRSWQWLHSWWDHYANGRDLFVLAVRDSDDALVGIAPWYAQRTGAWGRVVRFLGSGEVCSDYLTILATKERENDVVTAIAKWLTGEGENDSGGKHWDLLELTAVDASDSLIGDLVTQLLEAGCRTNPTPGLNCWRIELPGSWDEYLARFSKSHRKQVRRVERRLLETGEAVLQTAEEFQQLQQGIDILIDLHNRRRHSLNEDGCFASQQFTSFLQTAAARLFDNNRLNLHWIEIGGKPVAAEFHVIGGGVTYAYQAGVDPDSLELEPGRIINIATIKRAVDNGQQAFDFLRGDEPYKAHWRAESRPTVDIRIAANRTVSRIRHGVRRAGTTMKRWIKTGVTRMRLQ